MCVQQVRSRDALFGSGFVAAIFFTWTWMGVFRIRCEVDLVSK